MTGTKTVDINLERLELIWAKIRGDGFRNIASYQDGNEYFTRWVNDTGVQILIFVRYAGKAIDHYEVFREVSTSNQFNEYLDAISA